MGLFDYVHCELPLPEGQEDEYQTKDTDFPRMELCTITKDGRLVLSSRDYERTPENELPRPDIPWFGCMREVKGSERTVDQDYDGDLQFYTGDVTYRATFREGNCTEICQWSEGKWKQVWRRS